MFWNLWCEKVKFLSPVDSGSTLSETSVATSSTGSTLYLLDRKLINVNGIKQLWCKFGSSALFGGNENSDPNEETLARKWTDKHLYLGKDFDITLNYQPVVNQPAEDLKPKRSKKLVLKAQYRQTYMEEKGLNFGDSVKVNLQYFCILISITLYIFIISRSTYSFSIISTLFNSVDYQRKFIGKNK